MSEPNSKKRHHVLHIQIKDFQRQIFGEKVVALKHDTLTKIWYGSMTTHFGTQFTGNLYD